MPNQKYIEVGFQYIPYAYGPDSKIIEFKINVLEYTTIYELKNKMDGYLKAQNGGKKEESYQ